MNSMNILLISTVDFNRHGIPIAILNNYRLLNHDKIHCTFITNNSIDKDFAYEILKYGDEYFVLADRKKKTGLYICQLRKIAHEKKYDIAHIHGNSSTMLFELLALKGTCKIICQAHNTECVHSHMNRMLYPFFIMLTEYRTACSMEAGRFLYRKNKFDILGNGIDSNKFKFNSDIRKKVRSEHGAESNKIILHVGTFNEQKNQIFLVEYLEKLLCYEPRAVIWFVGDGENKEMIRRLFIQNKMGDKVEFIGVTDKVPEYMMAADCFVLPSKYESFGIVNIEAQATGLPCLLSNAVPKSVKLLDTVKFLDLQDRIETWIDGTLNLLNGQVTDDDRKKANIFVEKSKFDVHYSSRELEKYYYEVLKRE